MAGVRGGVEITTLADIPSAGSGLGSSSAVTVGLLHALFAYQGRQLTAEELADRACAIEIDRCRKPIGKQDQYAAALRRDLRHPVRAGRPGHRRPARAHAAGAPAGAGRASPVLHRDHPQREHHPRRADRQHRRPAAPAAPAARPRRRGGERAAGGRRRALGVALNKSWAAKRELASGVSNSADRRGRRGRARRRATGAKVTGAGGGGFLLVVCPLERQRAVREQLAAHAGAPDQDRPVRLAGDLQRPPRHLELRPCRPTPAPGSTRDGWSG